MVHAFATIGFALIAMASAFVIWAMIAENRAAIVAALGMAPVAPARRATDRRIRVRSVQPAMARVVQARRAA